MNELEIEAPDQGPKLVTAPIMAVLQRPVEMLDLSVRSYNCLTSNGITTIAALVMYDEQKLLGLRNSGRKPLIEIKDALDAIGLELGTKFYDRSTGRNVTADEVLANRANSSLYIYAPGHPLPLPHVSLGLQQELEHVFKQAGLENTEWPLPATVQAELTRRLRFARSLDANTQA